MMLANYLTAIILIVLGLFCVITKKDLIKIVLGLGITDYGINLFIVSLGFNEGGTSPQFAMNEIRPETFSDDINEAGKYISFKLNNAAYAQGQTKPMGCTLTGVVWHYGKIYLLNAGDSRTYRFRGGLLKQLTTDQTVRGISGNPLASKALLNCIGAGLNGKILTDDITNKLGENDVILICSDGLTDMLTDDEIEAVLNEGITEQGMAEGLAELLKEKACEAGGYDNVSIILGKL